MLERADWSNYDGPDYHGLTLTIEVTRSKPRT
jgi:hypothetical protein